MRLFFVLNARLCLRSKNKYWLARNQDNISECNDMSSHGLLIQCKNPNELVLLVQSGHLIGMHLLVVILLKNLSLTHSIYTDNLQCGHLLMGQWGYQHDQIYRCDNQENNWRSNGIDPNKLHYHKGKLLCMQLITEMLFFLFRIK